MYRYCIYCRTDLGSNEVIESFPIGRRLAFDSAKGRLWVVCRRCERWNLTPLEERWEAVEDCERRFRPCQTRVSTDNIGLARLREGLELVRIGPAMRPEFAAWRYGDQFGRRRRRAIMLTATVAVVGGAVAVGAVTTGIIAGGAAQLGQVLVHGLRMVGAKRILARVPAADGSRLRLRHKDLQKARLLPDVREESNLGWQLELAHASGTALLSGRFAMNAAGLIMPNLNSWGGSKYQVRDAVARIERAGGPTGLLRAAARERTLGPTTRLAVEMAVNEDNERAAMEGELELLEMAWRDAEEIAAVADNLLVPQETEHQLERLRQQHRS